MPIYANCIHKKYAESVWYVWGMRQEKWGTGCEKECETGDKRQEMWDRRHDTGDLTKEMWDRRCETGDVRQGTRHLTRDKRQVHLVKKLCVRIVWKIQFSYTFFPKMWHGGAKIKWHNGAVALMQWRENFSSKNGFVVQRRKDYKKCHTSQWLDLNKVAHTQHCWLLIPHWHLYPCQTEATRNLLG